MDMPLVISQQYVIYIDVPIHMYLYNRDFVIAFYMLLIFFKNPILYRKNSLKFNL